MARRQDIFAGRHRDGSLSQPVGHARHAERVDAQAASRRRLVRPPPSAADVCADISHLVSGRPDYGSQNLRDTELAGCTASPVGGLSRFHMIELYHHGSSVCSAKVRFVLMEKKLEWQSHYLDILKGEHFNPDYLKLNPMAVVPTLVHDGEILVESTVICEYLDDAFPEQPLKPRAALDCARMRLWTKAVDEHIQPACKYITYAACHRHIIARLPPDKFEQYMKGPEADAQTRVAG